mmetsp:Transcript_36901/g.81004  ORF Transcript_36901/g.81004 Transcript_36901/m.81004 type:complete len:314 (+) Transcript_36901:462-1403(+)
MRLCQRHVQDLLRLCALQLLEIAHVLAHQVTDEDQLWVEASQRIHEWQADEGDEALLRLRDGRDDSIHEGRRLPAERLLAVALREKLLEDSLHPREVERPRLSDGADVGGVQRVFEEERDVGVALVLAHVVAAEAERALGRLEVQTLERFEVLREVGGEDGVDDPVAQLPELRLRYARDEVVWRLQQKLQAQRDVHVLERMLVIVEERERRVRADEEIVVDSGVGHVVNGGGDQEGEHRKRRQRLAAVAFQLRPHDVDRRLHHVAHVDDVVVGHGQVVARQRLAEAPERVHLERPRHATVETQQLDSLGQIQG